MTLDEAKKIVQEESNLTGISFTIIGTPDEKDVEYGNYVSGDEKMPTFIEKITPQQHFEIDYLWA